MYKDKTNKMCVVKIYHTLINKETGYANLVRVGFLLLRSIFSLGIERKLNTGCGTALHIAVPNRQGVALPVMRGNRAQKPTDFWTSLAGFIRLCTRIFVLDVRGDFAEGCRSAKDRKFAYNLGGSSKGATPFMFISPLGEKKINK